MLKKMEFTSLRECLFIRIAAPLAFFAMLLWNFLFTKNTADDIILWSLTAVCVVCVLGALNCEYRQTFVFAMCGIVTFLLYFY